MHVCASCVASVHGGQKKVRSPELELQTCELARGCWEWNLGALQEQRISSPCSRSLDPASCSWYALPKDLKRSAAVPLPPDCWPPILVWFVPSAENTVNAYSGKEIHLRMP